MAERSRYSVDGKEVGLVLENKLKIRDQKSLEDIETLLLFDSYQHFFELLEKEKLRFHVKLIFEIHKYFLDTLYPWAGKIRTVNISKGDVLFCTSRYIDKALEEFEHTLTAQKILPDDEKEEASRKLAIIHCEFNAIHPFREGNGRTIRLFLDLMAVSNGFHLIDYDRSSQKQYIQACVKGMQQDYSEMKKIICKGLSL